MQLYKKQSRGRRAIVVSVVVFVLLVALIWSLIGQTSSRVGTEQTVNLKNALLRASVTCYAVEGRYPPTLEYLTENYGVAIDKTRFIVMYDVFSQNIMPDIQVLWIEGAAG